jgi:hypothetical protein
MLNKQKIGVKDEKRVLMIFLIAVFITVMSYAASITVNEPHNGTVWIRGKKVAITWSKAGSTGVNVKINIFKDSISQTNFIKQLKGLNTGLMQWKIPANFTTGMYILRIKGADANWNDTGIIGDSAPFRIQTIIFNNSLKNMKKFKRKKDIDLIKKMILPIKIISPAGDNWKEGSTYRIKWENKYTKSKRVNIYLLDYYDKKIIKVIAKDWLNLTAPGGDNNYGFFIWTIPKDIYKFSGNYRIKVERTDGGAVGLSKPFHISIVTEVKKYKIYALTSNKRKRRYQTKTVPLGGGAPFMSSEEAPNPGNGKLRIGYANFFKKDTISYNYVGYIYRAHAFFDVSFFKGKGLITKAILHFNHYKGVACGIRVYKVNKASSSLFKIDLDYIENPHNNIISIVQRWVAYPTSNFGILFTGINENFSHNNNKCVDYYDNVYLEIEMVERSK